MAAGEREQDRVDRARNREALGGIPGRPVAVGGGEPEPLGREPFRLAAGGVVDHPVEVQPGAGESDRGVRHAHLRQRQVRGDLTDPPAGAQRGCLPLRGGQPVEQAGQADPLRVDHPPHVVGAHDRFSPPHHAAGPGGGRGGPCGRVIG
jgi:hypothetical protein